MAFTSFGFIALALGFVLLTNALPSPRGRAAVLLGASMVFLGSYVQSWYEVLPFAGFLLAGYACIELLRRSRARAGLVACVVMMVGAFVLLKQYSFLGAEARLPFPYLTVGLSYVLFRLLHLMVDAQQGELSERLPVLSFVNYSINFLSFTAGPVQLYPDFAASQAAPLSLTRAQVADAFARVVWGFVKVAVLSAILNYAFAALSPRLLGSSGAVAGGGAVALFALTAAVYTAYLYANFSGYMDIVIGLGALAGVRLPENFDRPFRARSFLELWTRWHITLSNWFKLYVFNPLLKALAKRYPSGAAAPYLAVLAFFVTFLIMGLWHGSTSVFAIYGLFLALGASVNKWWQVFATARFGKKVYKAWAERPVVVYVSRGLTFAYFAVALTCLWVDLTQLLALLDRLGLAGALLAYAALALGAAVAFALADGAERALAGLRARAQSAPVFMRDLGLALQVLLVLSISSFFHKAPEFVYRAF